MEFFFSSESDMAVVHALQNCKNIVSSVLNAEAEKEILASLECKFRYIPIVMPLEKLEKYPARSRVLLRNRIVDCAPQLKHEIFLKNSQIEQIDEYISGMRTSLSALTDIGASEEQINAIFIALNNIVINK